LLPLLPFQHLAGLFLVPFIVSAHQTSFLPSLLFFSSQRPPLAQTSDSSRKSLPRASQLHCPGSPTPPYGGVVVDRHQIAFFPPSFWTPFQRPIYALNQTFMSFSVVPPFFGFSLARSQVQRLRCHMTRFFLCTLSWGIQGLSLIFSPPVCPPVLCLYPQGSALRHSIRPCRSLAVHWPDSSGTVFLDFSTFYPFPTPFPFTPRILFSPPFPIFFLLLLTGV